MFGEEHRETATSKNELALVLCEHGDLAGAEPMFRRESGDRRTACSGRGPSNIGAVEGNLAMVIIAKGDAAGAEKMLRESLASTRRVFGEAHPEYASMLNNLANAVRGQGGSRKRRSCSSKPPDRRAAAARRASAVA